jgi:bifunctional ADP-heptose synthase (sugar kinase/adenylyltransferase)
LTSGSRFDPLAKVMSWDRAREWRQGVPGRLVFTNGVFDLLHPGHVLAALEMVDAVVVFDQDTPFELIATLRPDVLVKGGDYTEASIVGAREVRSWGGDVVVIPLTPGHSTTSTIERLRGQRQGT